MSLNNGIHSGNCVEMNPSCADLLECAYTNLDGMCQSCDMALDPTKRQRKKRCIRLLPVNTAYCFTINF